MALTIILLVMTAWRRTGSFGGMAVATNVLLMTAGFALFGQQLAGYFYGSGAVA
jgi:hypothetical protein